VSLRNELLVAYFRLIREKRTWNDPRLLEREMRSSQRPSSERVPRRLRLRHRVDRLEVDGFPSYTLQRRGGGRGPHILHLHGGAYVQQIAPHHWRFVRRLVERMDAVVTVPLYPLAPKHEAPATLRVIREVYDRTVGTTDPDRRILSGDSAGGGLCLVLAQRLREEGYPQPGRIVLISPWVDVAMTNPQIPRQDARDPYLGTTGLIEAGERYAGPLDPTDPRVSPIYGSLAGLAPMTVFIGTRDVLLPDARRPPRPVAAAGVEVDYFEYSGQIHNWPMRRLPEAHRALDDLCASIVRSRVVGGGAADSPPGPPGPRRPRRIVSRGRGSPSWSPPR
jgi:epsilon-lactone hydrolase